MKSSALLALPFLMMMTAACDNGPRDVELLLEDDLAGDDGEDIRFATFGFASAFDNGDDVDVMLLTLIGSNDPNLCEKIGPDAGPFLADMGAGQIAGTFLFLNITFAGVDAPAADLSLLGDADNELVRLVDPQFLVSNGAGFQAQGVDIDREGQLDILEFDGQEMKANVFATLNQDGLDGGGIIFGGGDELNNFMSVQILRAPVCDAISEFLATQLED